MNLGDHSINHRANIFILIMRITTTVASANYPEFSAIISTSKLTTFIN